MVYRTHQSPITGGWWVETESPGTEGKRYGCISLVWAAPDEETCHAVVDDMNEKEQVRLRDMGEIISHRPYVRGGSRYRNVSVV